MQDFKLKTALTLEELDSGYTHRKHKARGDDVSLIICIHNRAMRTSREPSWNALTHRENKTREAKLHSV